MRRGDVVDKSLNIGYLVKMVVHLACAKVSQKIAAAASINSYMHSWHSSNPNPALKHYPDTSPP